MTIERLYDDQFAMAELTLDYNLHTAVQIIGGQETALLTGAQEFTVRSVLNGLARASDAAVDIRRERGILDGSDEAEQAFRREWFPAQRTIDVIRKQHRPHLRYLRGVAGVRAFYDGIASGALTFDEPHYDHQIDAHHKTAEYLAANDPFAESGAGAYHELAGGSGKSRLVAEITAAFKSQEDPKDPNRVLIIAPDLEVQAELVGANGESGIGKYAPHIKPGMMNQRKKEWDKEVVVATLNMVRNMLDENPAALERFDLILCDEVHKLLGEKTKEAVTGIRRQIIGFTGKGDYSEEKKVSDVLPELLAHRGTRELIERNELAPVQTWVCKTGIVAYQEAGRADYSRAELLRLSRIPERQQIAVDAARAFFRDNRNGVIICGSVEEAEAVAKAASGRVRMPDGRMRLVKVVPVHSGTKNNHATFQALNDNEIQAVTIVGIDTGWNVPRVSFEVMSTCGSAVKVAQRAARASRRCYDADGNVITSQYFEMMDIIRRTTANSGNTEVRELRKPTRQITVPELLGETVYNAGMIIAAPETDGKRQDFSLRQFPPHIRLAVSMADGVKLSRLPIFGAGVIRNKKESPEGFVSLAEAALGLGTTVARLRLAMIHEGVTAQRDSNLIHVGKKENVGLDLDKLARYLIESGEPIV